MELLYKLIISINKPHFTLLCANWVVRKKFTANNNSALRDNLEHLRFNMVEHWRELSEVENMCTVASQNFVVLAIFCQKLSNEMEIWRSSDKNNVAHFLWHGVQWRAAKSF